MSATERTADRREVPARRRGVAVALRSDAEALAAARELVPALAAEAGERDAQRRLPHTEVELLKTSGLLAITVPRAFGGAEVATTTLAEVVRLLASADASIAQIPQSHFTFLNALIEEGGDAARWRVFGAVLAGALLGNAQAEAGAPTARDLRTRLDGDTLTGLKSYCTGALFADWIPVVARDADDRLVVAYVEADAPGVEVVDDWDGLGQRTTASGTVRFDAVTVDPELVVPLHQVFERPQVYGASAQIVHTAIDVGIAAGALDTAAEFVRTKSRPWWEAEVERAVDDPLTVQRIGELAIEVRAAEALLASAATAVDAARSDLTADAAAAASIAVAAAKAYAARVAVDVPAALFEVAGTRSALASLGLDRFWRDGRTHTLHDPARWKVQHVGRYVLDGTHPPRHGAL